MSADHPASSPKKSNFRDKVNDSIFGLWSFRLVLISAIPSAVNQYIRSYVPTIAKTQGATLDQGALLMTLMGSVDLVSRLLVGLFADTHILKPSQILVISQTGLGILCQFLRFFDNFDKLIIMASGFGLFIGTRLTVMPMISMEVAGVERMPQAFSVTATLATLVGAGMNPLFSSIVQATGDFIAVLHVVGLCFIIGGLVLLLMPIMARIDIKNGRKKP